MTRMKWLGLAVWSLGMMQAQAQEITLRHDLEGPALSALAALTVRFNDGLKGKGRVILEDARGLEDRKSVPHLALLDPDDAGAFFHGKPRFLPLHQMLAQSGQAVNLRGLFPQILDAVVDASGRPTALPMAMSLPVLFLNRQVFDRAGVIPATGPLSWWELQKVAGSLFDKGVSCPLTSSRFSWVHVENVSAQHGEPLVRPQHKGTQVAANSLVNVKHLALLASWEKSRYFHYAGSGREGEERFLKGDCAMLTGPSSLYAGARSAGMTIDVIGLPHYDDVRDARPEDVLPDGASLWVLAGHKRADYILAARYVAYLMRPETQREWVAATAFLPMTSAAVDALRETGSFPGHLLEAARKRLMASRHSSTRLRHGPLRDLFRQFAGEEVAFVWSSGRAAKEALDNTVRRVNAAASAGIR